MIFVTRFSFLSYFSRIILFFVISLMTNTVLAQDWMPTLRDVHGDTVAYHYPPSDSVYVHNTIIIKFKQGALNKSLLCYSCSSDSNSSEYLSSPGTPYPYNSCRQSLLAEKFAIDSGILVSSTLASAIKSLGGTYLKRMTIANPCSDTLSVTRLGDTIGVDYYTWMVLELNNDTSAVTACAMLNIFQRSSVDVADLNYLFELCSDSVPRDMYYGSRQLSFSPDIIGMPTAWQYQVGKSSVRVAVIDIGGIDYRHCDFGGLGSSTPILDGVKFTNKVVGGWNYTDNNRLIYTNSSHGTAVAGIIGAYSNRGGCSLAGDDSTVSGIGGGWGTLGGSDDKGIGVSLLGYSTGGGSAHLTAQNVISAILQAVPNYPNNTKHGDAAHVINASFVISRDSILGGDSVYTPFSEATRRAVYETYKQGVSFVAARGNIGTSNVSAASDPQGVTATPSYPASYDGNWVISVGAAKSSKIRMAASGVERFDKAKGRGRYGTLDLIAPGGYENPENTAEATIFTTDMLANPDIAPYSSYRNFYHTSAATPHVAGVVGIMRSSVSDNPNYFSIPGTLLEPEDYEGILQATALRKSPQTIPIPHYERERGWGHLQADNVYKWVNTDNYRAKHYTTKVSVFDTSTWKNANNYFFTSNLQKGADGWKATTELITGANSGSVGYIRELTQTDTLDAQEWDTTGFDLFVWGRGGKGAVGGYSAANPNHRAGWAEVINGTGSNITNPNSPDSIYVAGIFHTNSFIVKCRTYQFKIVNTSNSSEIRFPADSSIKCNYTVFGKRKNFTSVRLSEEAPSEPRLSIKPNPATELITVEFALPSSTATTLEIIDVLGRCVTAPIKEYVTSGVYSQNVNVSNLPQGIYFCKLTCNRGSILIQSFVVGTTP